MKRKYIVYNSIALVLFNIAFWICNYYPRHIIDISSNAFVATTINAGLFLVHILLLLIVFNWDTTLFDEKLSAKSAGVRANLLKGVLLLCIQVLFELLIYFFKRHVDIDVSVFPDLLVLVVWLINYFVLTYKSKHKIRFSKAVAIIMVSVIIMSVICVIADSILIADLQRSYGKYRENSVRLNVIESNCYFLRSIVSVIYDSFIACALVFFHALRIERVENVDCGASRTSVSIFFVRVFVMVAAAFVLIAVKVTVSPYSCLKSTDVTRSESDVYVEDNRFHQNFRETHLYRVGSDRDLKLCYCSKRITIHCNNKNTWSFTYPFADEVYGFTEYEVDGKIVYVYGNNAVCYVKDSVPYTIPFADINNSPENPIISEICKKLIYDGNIVAFEYAVEYLKQYSPDFIVPYIDRYSKGEFSVTELATMDKSEYRYDYISNIAKSVK